MVGEEMKKSAILTFWKLTEDSGGGRNGNWEDACLLKIPYKIIQF